MHPRSPDDERGTVMPALNDNVCVIRIDKKLRPALAP